MTSVIVPVYNGAHVLPLTVPAMFAQEAKHAEWIFVNDGSTDETLSVLKSLLRDQESVSTKIVSLGSNRGRASARNAGLQVATGELVVFLDADAAPRPGFLSALDRAASEQGAVAAMAKLNMVSADDDDAYVRYSRSSLRGPKQSHARRPTPWKYFLAGGSCVHSEVLAQVGGFNEEISYGEDLELAARLSRLYPEGLRFAPDAQVDLHDIGTIESAIARMTEFGRDNLPALVAGYPEIANWTGVSMLDPSVRASVRSRVARSLLRPGLAKAVRSVLPYLPNPLSNMAVRYLLGYSLAKSFVEGRKALAQH